VHGAIRVGSEEGVSGAESHRMRNHLSGAAGYQDASRWEIEALP
jgi:hypothetical protein